MKKLLVLFILLVSSLYSQQVIPPMYGWNKIYEDTLGIGSKSDWAFNSVGTLVSKYADTTKCLVNKNVWGSAAIWVKIDSVTGYTDQPLVFYISYWNSEVGLGTSIASYAATSTSNLARFDLIASTATINQGRTVISPHLSTTVDYGNQIIHLSNSSVWVCNNAFILKFVTTCAMKVTIWIYRQ